MSTDDLKSPSTTLNISPGSIMCGITTPYSLRSIDKHYFSVKKITQFQSSKSFSDNSIDFEGTNLMSTFNNNTLKNVTLKSTTTHQYSI